MAAKIAIVSDTLVVMGGAERLLEAICEAFPDAPVFTILYDEHNGPKGLAPRITQSFLASIPFASKISKALFPLYPLAIESFDLSGFDIILSSSHSVAKGVLRTADQVHISYCHTPMRALWERTHEEVNGMPWIVRPLLRTLFSSLRIWDYVAAARVDVYLANSRITAKRISTHYNRSSTILTPPIDVDHFTLADEKGDYYLISSRNVPYKKIDLAIEAAEQLNRRLIVTGAGTDRLKRPSEFVEYRGKVSEDELLGLMRGARAFLAPQLEDFGMAMLEANACGTPVIALNRGGAKETQVDGITGVLFEEQSIDCLVSAIRRFENMRFEPKLIRSHAEKYSKQQFIEHLRRAVTQAQIDFTDDNFTLPRSASWELLENVR